MRQRSLFAVLGLLVILLLLTTLRLPFTPYIKDVLSDGFIPFLEFSSRIQARSRFLIDRVKAYKDLQIENSELKTKVTNLSSQVAHFGELEKENRDFRSMLDFKNRSELKLLSAKVISRDPSNWFNTVLIDRGSEDGVTGNMPVLTAEGLVGKTVEGGVTKHNARVILIVDENCKVSGWMRESGQYGIVQGNLLAGGNESPCRITFVDRSAQVKNNDLVYTSGLGEISGVGEIFPKGILIGTVNMVAVPTEANKRILFQEASITPAVDLKRINEVFVGVGAKPKTSKAKKS